MLCVPVEEAILEARETEEVVLFLDVRRRLGVDRTIALVEFVFEEVRLARHAVVTAVDVGLDVARVVTGLEQLAHAERVTLLGGADEVVVRDVQALPRLGKEWGDRVGELLGRHALGLGGLLDLQSVLVGSREEVYVIPTQAVPTGDGVRDDRGVGVTQVWLGVDVINRCRRGELGHLSTLMACPSLTP
ncbi:MAG: hypothetical protein RLZZ43_465 [Actinomycetota bacterium]